MPFWSHSREQHWVGGGGDPVTVLTDLARRKASGCLRVRACDRYASVYLLHGHVFHAEGSGGTGESVVVEALRWQAGEVAMDFDPRTKMPPVETVVADLSELTHTAGLGV